jgi:hypothetical protein
LNSRSLVRTLPWVAFFLAALTGCDESLPPRVDPLVVLVPSVRTNTVRVIFNSDTLVAGGELELDVRNIYNEVLSEKARIIADLTMRSPSDVDSSRSLTLTEDDIYKNKSLAFGILTVGVGDTVRLTRRWDHRFNGGAPLWLHARFHEDMTMDGKLYYRSDTLQVTISGKVQLFDRVQAIPLDHLVTPLVYLLFDMPPPPNLVPQRIAQ